MKDSFSGENIRPGTGLIFVKKDGTIHYFADQKTKRNMLKLGRNPNMVRWTQAYQKTKHTHLQHKAAAENKRAAAKAAADADEAPTRKKGKSK